MRQSQLMAKAYGTEKDKPLAEGPDIKVKEKPIHPEIIKVLKATDNKYKDMYSTTFSMSKSQQKNINKLFDTIAFIESSGGKLLTNPKSSARGSFQFLTKGTDSAFQTALNRYENLTNESPTWLKEAKVHNDPIKLSYAEQKALAIANIIEHPDKTIPLLNDVAKSGVIGNESSSSLYLNFHHTGLDEKTIKVAKDAFGISD